jgi:hypothetical protein
MRQPKGAQWARNLVILAIGLSVIGMGVVLYGSLR